MEDFLSGAPEESILGALLFNSFMCDRFLILKKFFFTGHADVNASFAVVDYIKDVTRSLGWRKYNYLFF